MKVSADARLAIPSLFGWATLVIVLNIGAEDPARTTMAASIAAAICGVVALVVFRRFPTLGLAVLLAAGLLVALAFRAPGHLTVEPWNEPVTNTPWFFAWADLLRERLLVASSSLPSTGGQLLPGLAIGDTSRVSQALLASMKTSSLTHITAVSGANCAIVIASMVALTARLGLSRRVRLVVAIVALVAFVVLVTPQPSVVRAAVMSLVVLVSLFSGRPGSGLPLLALAMTVILLWDPWWAIDYGFVLSVSATLGLLLFSGPLTHSLSRWMPGLLAAVIAIPLSAQLLCQPIIILLTPQIPTYGVVANVLAGPAAPVATVLGLIACLILPFAQPVGMFLLWIAWLPSEWIGQTATVCASLPLPSVPWLAGWWGVTCATAVSVLILAVLLSRRRWVMTVSALALSSGFVLALAISSINVVWGQAKIPDNWVLAACDVGQGDALVLRSQGRFALIDTGREKAPLEKCLRSLGVQRINLLILTHYDADHVGAIATLYGKVDEAIVGPTSDKRGQSIVSELAAGKAHIVHGVAGLTGTLGDFQWSVLWPSPTYPSMNTGNPGSITVLMRTPGLSALFLGDLGEKAQNALLSEGSVTAVDVVKVAHHGSADQSSALYAKIRAKFGIVSVGSGNSYGHPTSKTLDMLASQGATSLRTDRRGLIAVTMSGDHLGVWSERAG